MPSHHDLWPLAPSRGALRECRMALDGSQVSGDIVDADLGETQLLAVCTMDVVRRWAVSHVAPTKLGEGRCPWLMQRVEVTENEFGVENGSVGQVGQSSLAAPHCPVTYGHVVRMPVFRVHLECMPGQA